jgi:signal transduction histidine kinase
MNLSAWANNWAKTIHPKLFSLGVARLAVALIGLPIALTMLAMLLIAERETAGYQQLSSAKRWLDPLPASAQLTYDGLLAITNASPDFSATQWTDVTLPDIVEQRVQSSRTAREPMTRAWFRFTVQVPQGISPAEPLVLYGTRVMSSAYSVWVNGQPIWADLNDWRMLWARPIWILLPHQTLKPGQLLNIDLAVPHQTNQGYAVGTFYFGHAHSLRSAYNARVLLQNTLPVVGMVIVGIMGLLSFFLWNKRRNSPEYLWLTVTAIFLIVCNWQYVFEFSYDETRSAWFGSLVDSASSWLILAYVLFALRFNGHHYPRSEAALAWITVANTLLTLPIWGWQISALRLQHYTMLGFYVGVLGLLTWLAATRRTREHVLLCIGFWVLFVTGLHDVSYMTSRLSPDRIWIFPYGAFMLFFTGEYLLQRRYHAALGQVEKNNQILADKLQEREQQLLAKQVLLVQAEKEKARLGERARLAQDIHDGIGSALTGTLIGLRNTTTPDQAAQAVRECLDDIRIVMESLEPTANDLTTLLGTLRQRFANRLEGSSLRLLWDLGQLPPLPWLDAPQALDILRVVQEIITNTLKHARATEMHISASVAHAPGRPSVVLLTLADNGRGFCQNVQDSGKGLSNIRTRIERLGAQLLVTSRLEEGLAYHIRLPLVLPVASLS